MDESGAKTRSGARESVSKTLRELQVALEEEGVRHVALFGSVTRGDDLPESDMDVVLDLDPSKNLESLNFRRFNNFFKHRSDAPSTSPPAIA